MKKGHICPYRADEFTSMDGPSRMRTRVEAPLAVGDRVYVNAPGWGEEYQYEITGELSVRCTYTAATPAMVVAASTTPPQPRLYQIFRRTEPPTEKA